MMIKTLHVCMHVSIYACTVGWLHINKGVQACRPASKHVFVREHMQAHTACCRSGYIRLFYHVCLLRSAAAISVNGSSSRCRLAAPLTSVCFDLQPRSRSICPPDRTRSPPLPQGAAKSVTCCCVCRQPPRPNIAWRIGGE
jgi:hypothetical protein